MQLDLATAEYIGAREQQQDLAAALPFAGGALLVLADGLGGHESGAEASRIVVAAFKEAGAAGRFANPSTRRQALREALDFANARIAEGVDPAHGYRGMASTVVAAVVSNGELNWVSVGDSHLYIWRDGRLHKLNEDHSQAGLMVRSGQYQPSDPEVLAVKSVLVSALTGRKLEIVDLPQSSFRLRPDDVLMLASDGLNTLSDAEIENIVKEVSEHGAIKLSTALLESVRSRRLERQDNTTVVIARVLVPSRADLATVPAQRREIATADVIDDVIEERTQRATSNFDYAAAINENDFSPVEVGAKSDQSKSPEKKPLALGAASATRPGAPVPFDPAESAPASRSPYARRTLTLVLLLLLASGVAIAALKPGWLSAVVPSLGENTAPSTPATDVKSIPEPELIKPPAPATRPAEGAATLPAPQASPEAMQAVPSAAPAPVTPQPVPADPPLLEPERPAIRPEGLGRTP
ncbi:MAG: protein phosphatase 2C domain-containing protein [Hyphomicrobiaceae bacterium]